MMRKMIAVFLVLALALALGGCGGDSSVSVQRADQLMNLSLAGDRYAAMVISEDVTQIRRDSGKNILELNVEVGQEVKAGDILFTYDSEALELELEKQQLEIEKMQNEQVTYAEQQTKLENQLKNTWNESAKTRLTLEINTLKTTILENNYSILNKENSIADIQAILENADVVAPVDGVIRQINEEDGAQSYITIQQQGAYRVKGALNEMSMMGGIMPGVRIRAYSRIEAGKYWEGTVLSIDTDDSSQNDSNMWYGMAEDTMHTSSNYVFFAELDDTTGLMLGQHLYVQAAPSAPMEGLWIPEAFFIEFGIQEDTGEMTGSVWVAGSGNKLESRMVTLGMYDGMSGCYEIVSGLNGDEYIADPFAPGCEAGASVTYRNVSDFGGETAEDGV